MLKYVSKFTLDILPSVVATIIGAYIVNHYIVTKPGADTPVAAAVSSADPKNDLKTDAKAAPEAAKVDTKSEPKSDTKAVEKSADKPTEVRRPVREKTAAKPAPVQVSAPVVAAPATVPPVEAATATEEHRDANDLARAAIERLRGSNDALARTQEATRTPESIRSPETPRVVPAPVAAAPPVRALPPPIIVSTPAAEPFDSATGSTQMKPPYTVDARRPTPPADIPFSRPPLDLRAEVAEPHTSVAQDVLSAAKSVFHSVLPR